MSDILDEAMQIAANSPYWRKRQLRKKFRAWTLEHLRPGEYINLAYFIKVLDCGENEHARKWGKP